MKELLIDIQNQVQHMEDWIENSDISSHHCERLLAGLNDLKITLREKRTEIAMTEL